MNNLSKGSKIKKQVYDYLAKIVIIGNSAVGKTNLLLRFVDEKYAPVHTPTIGLDFRSKILTIPVNNKNNKKKLKLQLWDTAGQQRFRTLTDTYFKGASGIIITYAIDDRRSYEDVTNWIQQIQENAVDQIPKIIIGNKCDLQDQRKVSSQQGRMVAAQNNCTFMQVSARQNINISELFTQLSMKIINTIETEMALQVDNEKKDHEKGFQRKLSCILTSQPTPKKKECC